MAGLGKLNARTGMALAVSLGALARFVDIGAQSYSMDELWELTVIGLPAGEILIAGDGFPPLFHLIFKALVVGGLGDFSGRVFSAVLGVATVWLTGRLGRKISPAVGVAAALAVAVAPLLALLSKEARAYGLFIILAALLLLTTWNVIDSGSVGSWIGFGLVLALGMYTHYMFSLAVASAEFVLLWNLRRDPPRLKTWLYAHAAVALALVPLVLIAGADFETDVANDYSRTVDVGAIGYAGLSLFTGFTLGPSVRALHSMGTAEALQAAIPWLIIIGLPAAFLFVKGWLGLSTNWRVRLGVPLVVPLVLLTLFSSSIGVAFRVRYLSWLVIPLAIWLAAGYVTSAGKLRHVAAAVLLVVGVTAMITRVTVDDHRVEDARAAADYLAARPDVPAVSIAWYMTKPIEYYLGEDSATFLGEDEGWGRFDFHQQPDNRIVPIPSIRSVDPGMIEQTNTLENAVEVGEKYLFIYTRSFHGDPQGAFLSGRTVIDGLEPVAEYAGITIYQGHRGR